MNRVLAIINFSMVAINVAVMVWAAANGSHVWPMNLASAIMCFAVGVLCLH